MDTFERSLRLSNEIIIAEDITPLNSSNSSKNAGSSNSVKRDLNYTKTKIDESRMPVELRGKFWIFKAAIGEGKLNSTFLTLIIFIASLVGIYIEESVTVITVTNR